MAIHKVTRPAIRNKRSESRESSKRPKSHNGHTTRDGHKPSPYARLKGKIVDLLEITPGEHGCAIGIMFEDRTYLSFDVEFDPRMSVAPELSDFKSGEYRPLKRWPRIHSD